MSGEKGMGWADCGEDSKGRPIGYVHDATCDHPGCEATIHRGLAYVCGDMHGEDEVSCEGYFCSEHVSLLGLRDDKRVVRLCAECEKLAREHGVLADGE
jgi:hypothetical protein